LWRKNGKNKRAAAFRMKVPPGSNSSF